MLRQKAHGYGVASGHWLMAMAALGAALVRGSPRLATGLGPLLRGGVSICITVMFIFAEFIPNLGAPYDSSSPFRQKVVWQPLSEPLPLERKGSCLNCLCCTASTTFRLVLLVYCRFTHFGV